MADPLDAATKAIAKNHGCDRGTFTVCWPELEHGEACRCKEDARAAIRAYLSDPAWVEALARVILHRRITGGDPKVSPDQVWAVGPTGVCATAALTDARAVIARLLEGLG